MKNNSRTCWIALKESKRRWSHIMLVLLKRLKNCQEIRTLYEGQMLFYVLNMVA